RIRQAFKRFGSLPPEQREKLREKFKQMSPAERRAFIAGAQAQNQAGNAREFLRSIPPEERQPTRQMLQALSPAERRAFRQTWRGLPENQRDAYRHNLLHMTPQQRSTELAKPHPAANSREHRPQR
ncbi:MAG TPA: hypothetical protein VIC31_10860, partial [Rudaea sp.]